MLLQRIHQFLLSEGTIAVVIALSLLLALSCDTNLDYLQNPNQATPEIAEVEFIYNSIQINFEEFYGWVDFLNSGLGRVAPLISGYTYSTAFSPSDYNSIWRIAYAELLPDIQLMIDIADQTGGNLDIHAGSAMILKAYTMTTMVDIFGNVPYSEALKGIDKISPSDDPGASVYSEAEKVLDNAIGILTGTEAVIPVTDIFYDGDAARWITLANSLKLRIYNNTRLVDPDAGSKIAGLVAAGNIIDSENEDFNFKFSNNRLNPNSRHPYYYFSYEFNDPRYQSNYFMWLLKSEKRDAMGNPLKPDPRLRFYFYRQTNDLSFSDCQPAPEHYTAVDSDMPWCYASINGYYGQNHLYGGGTPPDGPFRAAAGLYPGGGQFDDNSFNLTAQSGTTGALGQGIWPILNSSFVYFMRAEAALMAGTGEDPRILLEQGVRASIEKVRSFEKFIDGDVVVGTNPTGVDITVQEAFLDPLDDDVDAYVSSVLNFYDASSDPLDVIMKEYLIAIYGNGLEAYNNLRRTTKPTNVQPPIQGNLGNFLWSAWYPASHVNLNANAKQKQDVYQHVFWDTNADDAVR